ncbi:collagen-binding protein [Chitinophaga terrae (ex Kim and Jung 2007)]|nr:collagen-binding protein [Chitinophaga terrae (ex Kim and Jung 2007)]
MTLLPLQGSSLKYFASDDSIKAKTINSDNNGAFLISNIKFENITIVISYLGYKQRIIRLPKSDKNLSLSIGMESTGLNLSAVEIRSTKPIVSYLGDTIQYEATMVKVNPDEMISAILKKTPGFALNKDGIVTYNGEPVNKILLNGRIFFGNDIKKALTLIPAELINKIQVYDAYSDQSTASGERNIKEKVLNITVKEDSKNKITGLATLGAGSSKTYASKAVLNKFNNSGQYSFFEEGNNMGGYLDPWGANSLKSEAWNAGLNYSGELGKKIAISANYTLYKESKHTSQQFNKTTFLSDTTIQYSQNQVTINSQVSNNLLTRINYNIDSSNSILFDNSIILGKSTSNTLSDYFTKVDDSLINIGQNKINDQKRITSINQSIYYQKKFNGNGHQLSVSINFSSIHSPSLQYNNSFNKYKESAIEDSTIYYDQKNNLFSNISNMRLSIFYNIPLTGKYSLQINSSTSKEKTNKDQAYHNFDNTSKEYNIPDDSLSSKITNFLKKNSLKVSLQYEHKKLRYYLAIEYANVKNTLNLNKNVNFPNINTRKLLPSAFFNYKIKALSTLQLAYKSQIKAPIFFQLYTLPDNTNSTIRRYGNESLIPELSHNIEFVYNNVSKKENNTFRAQLNYNLTQNHIIESISILNGNQFITYENINGLNATELLINNSRIVNNHFNFETAFNINLSKNPYTTGNNKYYSKNQSYTPSLSFNYKLKNLLSVGFSKIYSYTVIKYSNGLESLKIKNLSIAGSLNLYLTKDIFYNANYSYSASYIQSEKLQASTLNMDISKSFLKRKNLLIKFQTFDMLNTNKNIIRNVGNNYIESYQIGTLGRVYLLSGSYIFK